MKRILGALLSLALLAVPLHADGIQNPGATLTAGQLPGTTTNDNACAGCVGQILTSDCPGITTTATVTITIATPAIVTWTSPPFHNTAINQDNCPIVFTTTGALPTGITSGTTYWVIASSISGNTFQIATSVPNALAGTAVATSGTQSGVQTATASATTASATAKSIGGLTIPAGDWEISALCMQYPNASTTSSQFVCNLSQTDNTLNVTPSDNMAIAIIGAAMSAGSQNFLPTNTGRFSFATPTNVFAVVQSTFAVNTMNAAAMIHARRAR
ncbi:MAG: hypothetical protein EPN91_05700 [Salinibacterium sp.]|nr:MAG: hypothetical protein EPN91_05700 [Salinibacterium sp.]